MLSDENPNLPAVIPDTQCGPLNPLAGGVSVWMSRAIDSPEMASLAAAAVDSECPHISTVVNTTVQIKDVAIHETDGQYGEDGLWTTRRRIVLLLADGSMIWTTAGGPFKSLGLLFAQFGLPPWQPALPVKVVSVPCGGDHHTYRLRSTPESYSSRQPAGGKKGKV